MQKDKVNKKIVPQRKCGTIFYYIMEITDSATSVATAERIINTVYDTHNGLENTAGGAGKNITAGAVVVVTAIAVRADTADIATVVSAATTTV